MLSRRVSVSLAIGAMASVLAVLPLWADSHARIVRLSYVEGNIEIDRRDGRGFERAFLNMPITQGVRLSTHDDARAEVEFEDGSTVRLAPKTNLEFQELGLHDSGAKQTSVDVQEGTAYFNLRRKGNDEFNVSVSHEQISIPKSARFRVEAGQAATKIAVFDGSVDLKGPSSSITVKKNQTVSMNDGSPFDLSKGVEAAAYDRWDKEREDYRDQYAASSYRSPYVYGLNDLNYYGSYFNYGGYGTLWRPYYAPAGWDPFFDGAWVFYPGFGYTWVSAYPWGWTPFHYGSWLFVPGYGWCWRPATVWNTWVPVTAVVNPPAGFKPPAPPASSGAGVVTVGHGPAIGSGNGGGGSRLHNRFPLDGGVSNVVPGMRSGALTGSSGGAVGSAPAMHAPPRVVPAPAPRMIGQPAPHVAPAPSPSHTSRPH